MRIDVHIAASGTGPQSKKLYQYSYDGQGRHVSQSIYRESYQGKGTKKGPNTFSLTRLGSSANQKYWLRHWYRDGELEEIIRVK